MGEVSLRVKLGRPCKVFAINLTSCYVCHCPPPPVIVPIYIYFFSLSLPRADNPSARVEPEERAQPRKSRGALREKGTRS